MELSAGDCELCEMTRAVTTPSAAAGFRTGFVVTSRGALFVFGQNTKGQLGLPGTPGPVLHPTRVPGLPPLTAVSSCWLHTLALAVDGRVFAFGENEEGELGLGHVSIAVHRPTPVTGLPRTVVAVSVGAFFSLFLTSEGRVFACGMNEQGQLGMGDLNGRLFPTPIPALPPIVQISAGFHHSLALSTDGRVFAWGRSLESQLGPETRTRDNTRPTEVVLLPGPVKQVSAGGRHSLVLLGDGRVFVFGAGKSRPSWVQGLPPISRVEASASSLFLDVGGRVWAQDVEGTAAGGLQVGPTPLVLRTPVPILAITQGPNQALFVGSNGRLFSFGLNRAGELGLGDAEPRRPYIPDLTVFEVPGLQL